MIKLFSLFNSLKNLFSFLKLNISQKEFVFFSESRFYRYHFIDLMDILLKKGKKNIVFITPDKEEYHFYKKKFKSFLIDNNLILQIFFKILSCKFLIMTLTDLGNHYQKSKLCNYYVYFFHALASTHKIYTSSAFSNYDIIFTNGEYQKKELEYAELKFKLPKKEIINTGYFFLDNLNKRAQKSINQKRQILFAPSWNYNEINLFNNYSLKIIEELLNNNFKVILRPHSEHYTRSKEVIKKIENKFKENTNFDIDHKSLNLDSLEKSEILITDNSAVVFEFLLIFKRPIIYIDYVDKIHNSILDQIPLTTLDDKFKKIFGNVINITDISDLSNLCEKLLNNNHLSSNKIDIFIKEHFSNFRSSSNFAAEYLIKKSIETDISKDN